MVQCDHHHFGSHRSFCQHLQPRSVDQKTQEFNVLQAVEGKYYLGVPTSFGRDFLQKY